MEKIVFSVIVLTGVCCLSTKHIFHDESDKTWEKARAHCRAYHNDLSRLSNGLEEELFKESVGLNKEGWIGIYWDQSIKSFVWSGGEKVTDFSKLGLPNTIDINDPPHLADNILWNNNGWHWENGAGGRKFFCFSLTLVQEEKTWEEALELCRMNHNNLSSLLSDTDVRLATNEMNYTHNTEPVWIGLRYLADEWLWVNGDHLNYKSWSQEGDQDHRCPVKHRCGALTKRGVWESRDCQEKLWFMCG
ncbi:lymphocyte antigen 75 [Austrofundulus limnaeus]|uniref:Lymphocyte antigen 75 n=1 Tax=Austrofundulus limnaeus TaxID=52670 RepID=A0A2I4AXU6_AUSLI|nr:PREDICTED: lymphocyte antigen 75-like [Austrofundulus limnaeus]